MYIDIFLLIFVLIGIIQGFHRGIIRTAFAILGIVVGVLVALKFSPVVIDLFEKAFNLDPLLSLILGLLLTFVVVMWGIQWLGKGLEKTLRIARLNFINKLAGGVLFALLMVVTYSAIIWFIGQTDLLGENQKAQSRSYPYLMEIPARVGEVVDSLEPVFKGFWDKIDAILNPEEGNEG